MDQRLAKMGLEGELPKYKITDYSSDWVEGDDLLDVYTIDFKDDDVKRLIPKLDSLCQADSRWTKDGESYTFKEAFVEAEILKTFTINPNNKTAEYRYLRW